MIPGTPRRERTGTALPGGPRASLASAPVVVAALAALSLATPPASAQPLEERIEGVRDGWVRFGFEAREGVCGRRGGIYISGPHEGCDCVCENGPLWVDLELTGGEVGRLEMSVGRQPETRSGPLTDLGLVEPGTASTYLLDLAERAPAEVGEDAIGPAVLARGVVTWPRLLSIARRERIPLETREKAVFWVGQAAAERAVDGLESVIRNDGELEVRRHAVFALSRHESPRALDALLEVARSHREPELRKAALFWLGRRADEDSRVLALFEEILSGG